MLPARTSPVIGLVAALALLAAIAATVGLGGAGWVVGTACAVTMSVLLAGGLARHGVVRLGPADRVTLTRATLAVGVAALVADSFAGTTPVTLLVTLTVVALLLDTIDGRVARRTGTTSAFGARFDLEVDAFLILVLSVDVARTTGTWVLAIGAARYGFVAAGWLLPWLRLSLPAAALVQGGGGDAGRRPDDRGGRRPPRCRRGRRAGGRARAAGRVLRP